MKYTGNPIHNIEALSSLLGTTPAELGYLSFNMSKNVRLTSIPKKHSPNESREITAPSDKLKKIQRNVKDYILANYVYEDYIYGLGVSTLKDHAMVHRGNSTVVQVDLKSFYPSISHALVYRMWVEKFGFPVAVARILTKITTMDGGLKQGFPTSSHIAAIVAEDYTLGISNYCKQNKYEFTQYVDDLNISGSEINYRTTFKKVVSLGRPYGLAIKKNKTRVTSRLDGKTITGVSLLNQQTRATRGVRQRSIRALKNLSSSPRDEHSRKQVAGYAGFLKHLNTHDGKRYRKHVADIDSREVR